LLTCECSVFGPSSELLRILVPDARTHTFSI
jgi:hypothetical protein